MATNATPPPKPVPIWKWYEKAELRGAVATERFMMVEEVRTGKQIGIDIAYPPGVGYKDVMKDMKNVQELKSGRTLVEISASYSPLSTAPAIVHNLSIC